MLEVEDILPILKPDGSLSRYIKGYEPREQQQGMLSNVVEAYNQNKIALIEAGTGTGKSMAYLLPAIMWSQKRGERTLISTNTIALQEQLIFKDIPLAMKAANTSLKAVLVKGMGNYVCMRKLHDVRYEKGMLPDKDAEELDQIEKWAAYTKDGSLADLPITPSYNTWERVSAETDTCNRRDCPFFHECHFFKARKEAEDAQILVTNHSMLFADLAYRMEEDQKKEQGLIPDYHKVVIDEAHNIEDTATEFYALKTSQFHMMKTLRKLAGDKGGKLTQLRIKMDEIFRKKRSPEVENLFTRLTIDLAATPHGLNILIADTFQVLKDFTESLKSAEEEEKGIEKIRIMPRHLVENEWSARVIPHTTMLIQAIKQFTAAIRSFEQDLKSIEHPKLGEHTETVRFEINALVNRLEQSGLILETFTAQECPKTRVRWIEIQQLKTMSNLHLIDANLDIAKVLADSLFNKFPTTILCSATLTTNQSFSFIRKRLGIVPEFVKKTATENIYTSPFDYNKQALLVIPTDIPPPNDPNYLEAVYLNIWNVIQASRGNAFLLFTSYSMLQSCYDKLAKKLTENRFHVLKQGEASRQTLLNNFKSKEHSVLFGTDSFWEGVDVPGDALRCVIIVKLPFKVPSEPLIQARTELITADGGDPFFDYSVPLAIVKFKQGFGRLIRNKRDRGCVVCLDKRVITKGYGRLFLNSLPPCKQLFSTGADIIEAMKEFYKKTHHLTLKTTT